jgi:hypothetical protein
MTGIKKNWNENGVDALIQRLFEDPGKQAVKAPFKTMAMGWNNGF